MTELQDLIHVLQRHDIFDYKREQTLRKIRSLLCTNGYISEFSIYPFKGSPRIQVDFANPISKHIVELDGPGHGNHRKQHLIDQYRDEQTVRLGWRTTRIRHK